MLPSDAKLRVNLTFTYYDTTPTCGNDHTGDHTEACSISSEISSGSIKSLIISPTRRWKIFAAKFLALLSALVIAATIGFIASLVSGYVYFRADTFSPYVYASAGTAHEIAGIA